MGKRIGRFVVFGLFVLMAMAFLTCGAFAADEPVVKEWAIPQITILTGPGAPFGLDAAWGVERAVKEINEAGGIRGVPIKITQYDTAYDTAKAVQVMTKALEKKPLVVIGPMDQTGIEACGHLPVKEGVPFLSSLSAPSVRQKFEPWGCSLYPDIEGGATQASAEWFKLNPDIKSVVLFYLPTEPSHVLMVEAQEKEFAKLGIKILEKIEVTIGQLDLGPQAARALALKADGFYSHLNVMEHPKLCKALYERGMKEGRRIICGAGATGGALFEAGKGYLEDSYLWDFNNFTSPSERWKAYVEAYKADHKGLFPYSMAIHGQYEAVYAIKAAFENLKITGDPAKLKEEREKIRDFLWNAKGIDNPAGDKWNYVNGQKVAPLYIYQIKNNELTSVKVVAPQ